LSSRCDSNNEPIYLPLGYRLSALTERLMAQYHLFAQHDAFDWLIGPEPDGAQADRASNPLCMRSTLIRIVCTLLM
jgi:hypothetical protein